MQVSTKLIKKQFEQSMNSYDENAIVQKLMAQKLVKKLCEISGSFENILELGSGTGILATEITQNIRYKHYYANDLVEKSKKYLEKILPEFTFLCGNAIKINPSRNMDLIISNAMFQWFSDLEKVSDKLKNYINTGGILAFTTFSPNNFREINKITGLSLNYSSKEDIIKIFSKNFQILYTEEFEEKLNFSSPLELLAHMKKTGVNSLSKNHWTFKDVKEFCEKYSREFPKNTLTYAPIIVICKKL